MGRQHQGVQELSNNALKFSFSLTRHVIFEYYHYGDKYILVRLDSQTPFPTPTETETLVNFCHKKNSRNTVILDI